MNTDKNDICEREKLLNDYVEAVLLTVKKSINIELVREELKAIRALKLKAIFLEVRLSINQVLLDEAVETTTKLVKISEEDDKFIALLEKQLDLAEIRMDNYEAIIDSHEKKPYMLAKSGGEGKAAKFKKLEAETIRLYELGTWESTPIAAQEITPKIVELSKNGNGDLMPSTIKPLQWIRNHIKSKKL